jgi:hypothetical protein
LSQSTLGKRLRRAYGLQERLIVVLPSAAAAMDASKGVDKVAKRGLGLLCKLSFAPSNKVRLQQSEPEAAAASDGGVASSEANVLCLSDVAFIGHLLPHGAYHVPRSHSGSVPVVRRCH